MKPTFVQAILLTGYLMDEQHRYEVAEKNAQHAEALKTSQQPKKIPLHKLQVVPNDG